MTHATFHAGERAVQAKAGVAGRMAEVGPRVIRDHMPGQHREFFAQLPFVLVGTVDAAGQPWASVLASAPGFMQAADPFTLLIRAMPLPGDPLQANLHEGAPLGLLGLEPHTRRRNRMNGVVKKIDETGFAVHVAQSFGNCPKYIQTRDSSFMPGRLPVTPVTPVIHEGKQLDAAARQLIANADTFFIATSYGTNTASEVANRSHGVDVSHRGGKPGFVRVDADGTLTVPDFSGNFFFNTLGNIATHPRAGLLIMDYATGDVLYLAVSAEIVWDGVELQAFIGAQRLLRFKVLAMRRVEAVLPLRWGPAELSPVLAGTGAWV